MREMKRECKGKGRPDCEGVYTGGMAGTHSLARVPLQQNICAIGVKEWQSLIKLTGAKHEMLGLLLWLCTSLDFQALSLVRT